MRQATSQKQLIEPVITVEILEHLNDDDLRDLCEITRATIETQDGGFGWIACPAPEVIERYWRGVMLVPGLHLIVTRADNVICGAVQIAEPSRHNQAQQFAVNLKAHFVAPWVRGQKIGQSLLQTAENLAISKGYNFIHLDVRETQTAAIALYERMSYKKWGENPHYIYINRAFVSGLYYSKAIG